MLLGLRELKGDAPGNTEQAASAELRLAWTIKGQEGAKVPSAGWISIAKKEMLPPGWPHNSQPADVLPGMG